MPTTESRKLASIAEQLRRIPARMHDAIRERKMNSAGEAASVAGSLLVQAIEAGAFSDNPELLLAVQHSMATESEGMKRGRAYCQAAKVLLNRPQGQCTDLVADGCPAIADGIERLLKDADAKPPAVMQSQPAGHAGPANAAITRMILAVNAACDNYIDWYGATVDYHAMIQPHPEVKAAFHHDDRSQTRKLYRHEQDLLLKARMRADEAYKAGQLIVATVKAAVESVSRETVNELMAARVVAEPVQWAVELTGKLHALATLSSWKWDHPKHSMQDRWAGVQAIATMIAPVQRWLDMGSPAGDGAALGVSMAALKDVVAAAIGSVQPANGGQAKRKRRNRKTGEPVKALTAKQTEAMHLFGEHKGNIVAVAKAMGVDRKTAEQHIQAAHAKLGTQATKSLTRGMATDSRGQAAIASEDDGPGVATLGRARRIERDRRR